MDNVLDKLDKIVEDQGLTPEVSGVVLGTLMVDNVWEEFIDRIKAA